MPTSHNPLTLLRKLGTSLVGDDGLLTNAASVALGYSPVDRVKNRIAARGVVQGEERFRQGQLKAAQDLEQGALGIRKGEYELGRAPVEDAQRDLIHNQAQATRTAKGAQYARNISDATAVGPPNPDGSPILAISPDEALGRMEAERDDPTDVLNPALRAMYEKQGLDMSSVPQGMRIPDRQIAQLSQAANVQSAVQGRRDALRESSLNRATARNAQDETRRLNTYLDEQNRAATTPVIRASQRVLATALDTRQQFKRYEAAKASGNADAANQILGEVMTVAFARVRDPDSAVKEGEVTRLLQQWGLADQAGNWLNKNIDGGVLPPDALYALQDALEADAEASYAIINHQNERLERMRQGGGNALPEFYKNDLSIGYTPRVKPGTPDPSLDSFFPPAPRR